MVYRVHLQHLELDRLTLFHRVARILDVGDAELRHWDKALDVAPQIHHHALSMRRSTRPRSSVPTGYVSPMRSHGSSCACFRPSEIRLFSASTFRISTSTSSPFFTTSEGCCTRLVHDMSEM